MYHDITLWHNANRNTVVFSLFQEVEHFKPFEKTTDIFFLNLYFLIQLVVYFVQKW